MLIKCKCVYILVNVVVTVESTLDDKEMWSQCNLGILLVNNTITSHLLVHSLQKYS
jgi:hypothetical protein